MKITLLIYLFTAGLLHAGIDQWLTNIDREHSKKNLVTSASIQRQYEYLKEKHPIDLKSITIDEFLKELESAGRRNLQGLEKSSDVYLGYAYCDAVGINTDALLARARCNEMFLTWLIVELVTDLKVQPTGQFSIKTH